MAELDPFEGTSAAAAPVQQAGPDPFAGTMADPAVQQAQARLTTSADANPDQAAKAIQIGDQMGADSAAVNNDYKNFEKLYGIGASAAIVGSNPWLTNYINSHPLAASVSKDDWPSLHEFTQAASKIFHGPSTIGGAAVDAFTKSLWEAPAPSASVPPSWQQLPYSSMAWNAVGAPLSLLGTVFLDAIPAAVHAGVKAFATQAGASDNEATQVANTFAGMVQYHFMSGEATHEIPETQAINLQTNHFLRMVEPYIRSGEEPPATLHPWVADYQKAVAEQFRDNLGDAVKAAVATKTRERSAQLFGDHLVSQIAGDTTFGISSDAVRDLYGDEIPAPDDGKLGWVPRIQEQLQNAAATGGDIEVPLKDWLAKVEPEVQKALADHIRPTPGGVTVAESKELETVEAQVPPEAVPTTPIDAIRTAAGLQDSNLHPVGAAVTPEELRGEVDPMADLDMQVRELLRKRLVEDDNWTNAQIQREEKQRQTAEWAEHRAEMRPEVEHAVKLDPGQQLDTQLRQGVKLDPLTMTDEQKATIPAKFQRRGGQDINIVAAGMNKTSDELVQAYKQFTDARDASGMQPDAFIERMIDAETDRRMEVRYGNLEENIIEATAEHILSDTEERARYMITKGLADQAGQQFESRNVIKARVQERLGQMPIGEISSKSFLNDSGRAGLRIRGALAKGDVLAAFGHASQQLEAVMAAREAMKIEKRVAQFKKVAKQVSKVEPKGISLEWANAIQAILAKIGEKIPHDPSYIKQEFDAGKFGDLAGFIAAKEAEHEIEGLEINVPDFIFDPTFNKGLDQLTADEFVALKEGVDTLNHLGRNIDKYERLGKKYEVKEFGLKAAQQLAKKFVRRLRPPGKGQRSRTVRAARSAVAAITEMETLWRRWDGRDPKGLFTTTLMYPGAEAANYADRLRREMSPEFGAIGRIDHPNKQIPFPDHWDKDNAPYSKLTRENLAAMVSNIGNEYNLRALANTLGFLKEEPDGKGGTRVVPDLDATMAYIEKNTTAEDIKRGQALGDLFNKLKTMHDVVERNIKGAATENIRPRPFTMHGQQFDGWYHPIIDDRSRSPQRLEFENKPTTFWPSVATGFLKRRTGAQHILDLSYDMVPAKLNQLIHAIAFKEYIHNTAKLMKNKDFQRAVQEHYGPEYVDEMNQWLMDVAGNASYNSGAWAEMKRVSDDLRQNIISSYIAFNPTTIQKHGLTAWLMSAQQVGYGKFGKALGQIAAESTLRGIARPFKPIFGAVNVESYNRAVHDLFSKDPYLGESLWQFIKRNSEEIQRRERNYEATMTGQHQVLLGKSTLRHKIMQWGAQGVAMSDMISAAPTWLAKYRDTFAETGEHGMAVNEANAAVRLAHGSTAITNLPRAVRSTGILAPWMTSFYGFMGTVLQRRIEIAHDVADSYRLVRAGEFAEAAKKVPGITARMFVYGVWPALVDLAVADQFTEDRRSWWEAILDETGLGLANGVLGLRDWVYGIAHTGSPNAGLMLTIPQDVQKVIQDITKPHPMDRAHAGKFVGDALNVVGDATGKVPRIVSNIVKLGINQAVGGPKPRTAGEAYRAVVRGRIKPVVIK